MNSTNRTLNRTVLILVGLLCLVCGLGAIAITVLPVGDELWRRSTPNVADALAQAWQSGVAFAGLSRVPWLLLAGPVGAVILIALLLIFVFSQGNGRTSKLVDAIALPRGGTGSVTVDVAVAAEIVQHAVASRPEVVAASTSAYRVKGKPALKVTVTPRRGAAPAGVLAEVERAAAELDDLLGVRVPIFVHLNGGVRSAVSKAVRAA